MLRSTAHLLIVVMLVASGRLLACGIECLDELTVPEQASCHQDSAPVAALHAGGMHACLPEVAEPRVTVAKPASANMLVAMPLVTPLIAPARVAGGTGRSAASGVLRFESPHPPAPSVLRI